jgi:hypothetical protein
MDALPKIFGSRDFFDNAESAQILGSLVGLGEGKPFECVATIDETVTALSLCVETAERRKRTLPPGLQYVKDVVLPRFQDRTMDVQKWFDDGFRVDRLPASIEAALTKELGGR